MQVLMIIKLFVFAELNMGSSDEIFAKKDKLEICKKINWKFAKKCNKKNCKKMKKITPPAGDAGF